MNNTVNWLFLDLNAYFASVEQQVTPALRGKPVAVVPMLTDNTCCIAASYEAKAYGIKTGTRVGDAKKICPTLHLVEAVPQLYVRYHKAIVETVESLIPIAAVMSIDEMVCQLTGSQQEVSNAVALAHQIKRAILERVGECLRCSIGIGPNRYLSKVAGDMQKPDGLTIIRLGDLPQALYGLELSDFPGIGPRMEARLHQKRIFTVVQLCALSRDQMREVWGGIVGERFHAWLHGEQVEGPETHRSSVGHSHVLPPEFRTMNGAYQIVRKLTGKLGVRLRQMGYWAKGMTLAVQFLGGRDWNDKTKLMETQDTPTLLKTVAALWAHVPAGKPLWVGVTLSPIIPIDQHIPSLFENPKQEKLSLVMDRINEKFGRNTAYFGEEMGAEENAPTRISFTRIPDNGEF
jgi:DNA polymerase-4